MRGSPGFVDREEKGGSAMQPARRPAGDQPVSVLVVGVGPLGRQLQAYVCARVPILYLVSWEEERVLREIELVAIAQRKRCYLWTETEGAQNVALSAAGKAEQIAFVLAAEFRFHGVSCSGRISPGRARNGNPDHIR